MAPTALAKNDFASVGSSRKQTFMPLWFGLVIAPAFNLVNMLVYFLLSVILHFLYSFLLTRYLLKTLIILFMFSIKLFDRLLAQPPDCTEDPEEQEETSHPFGNNHTPSGVSLPGLSRISLVFLLCDTHRL